MSKSNNPYLLLGFWEFAILSTLMVVFFPWSLLFSLLVYGMETTKLLVQALLFDAARTFGALLTGVAVILIGLLLIALLFLAL